MGFCRRCGDIVTGTRCKCGGLAVAPSVDFSQTTADLKQPDLWSRTYVRSTTPPSSTARERSLTLPSFSKPANNFPKFLRPQSTRVPASPLADSVSSHIESISVQHSTIPSKPDSKKKAIEDDASSTTNDILSDPYTSTLSKAYGSVLQPKESLMTFTCYICSMPFPPDGTIYPDPNDLTTTRFLCKPCFTTNGGAKGDCAACARPILILSSEGGFIENAGRIWHRRCFRCDGCFKDISDAPMVDLLGRPSCEDCFDSCLKRPYMDSQSPRRVPNTPDNGEKRSNLGGMKGTSREGSPAIEELQQRLGIKSREDTSLVELPSPATTASVDSDLKGNTSLLEDNSFRPSDASPRCRYEKFRLSNKSPKILSPSPRADNNHVAEMERRLLRRSYAGSPSMRSVSPVTSLSRDSIGVASSTPDLTDYSDTNTAYSASPTPPSSSPHDMFSHRTPTKTPHTPPTSRTSVSPVKIALNSPSTPCGKCSKPLFRTQNGGKFVTVPEESAKCLPPKSFHVECFRCAVCDEPFEETRNGQAVFVRSSTGCCHVACATPERIVIRPLRSKPSSVSLASSSLSKQERPPRTAPPTMNAFPRFGSGAICPGCRISVSPMERGVVPGPQGSRWHASCLACGGKAAIPGRRRKPGIPGCGKRLDSAAKTDGEGGVWCRECLLLIPSSSLESSIRPLMASHTGGTPFAGFPSTDMRRGEGILSQLTGTTTIARQFTGMGALTSQLTGGGLSPTRQLANRSSSPTKMTLSGGDGATADRVPAPEECNQYAWKERR